MSFRVQKPFEKVPIILTWCNTRKGCGKGTFKLFLQKLFSCNENILTSYNKIGQFTSNFNSELETCLFLVLEEVSATKNNSLKEFSGLLKDISSMTELLVEKKGMDRRICPFYGNVIIFSNEFFCVQVSHDNRRHVIFETNNEKSNDTEFFQNVYQELNNLEVMKSAWNFFLHLDISNWDFRKLPKTELLKRLQRCSESIEMKFARWFFKKHNFSDITINETDLYMYWCEFCDETGIQNKRDCMYVGSSFENVVSLKKLENTYFIASADIQKYID